MKTFAAIWTAISLWALAAGAAAAACTTVEFEEAPFTVCTATPGTDDIRLVLDDAEGARIGTFDRLEETLAAQGRRVVFAMNAGMYHPDRRPVGLYVENGVQASRLVTRAGPGNFGMLPNGVLCLNPGKAEIVESRAFEAGGRACDFATQSGPMLVLDDALHPRFLPDSRSRFVRNGVGVGANGTLYAAISDAPVTFHRFARLFRDRLGTPNALFLDGNISRLYAPELGRHDLGFPMGPILVVTLPRD